MDLNNSRIKLFLLVMLLLIFFITPLSFAATGSYSLPEAKETIVVQDDGTTVITDEITYSISGTVNGVTKIIHFEWSAVNYECFCRNARIL